MTKFSLTFVPKSSVDSKQILSEVMAYRLMGANQVGPSSLSQTYVTGIDSQVSV